MTDQPKTAAKVRRMILVLGVCITCCAVTGNAWAHDARPLSVVIVEQQEHVYRVDVRIPPSVELSNQPGITWPGGCTVRRGVVRNDADSGVETMLLTCPAPLEGNLIGIRYPLFNPSISTLFRFYPASGATRTAVLPPEQSAWPVPAEADWKTVARDYLLLGIKHIWAGIDHLLFVAGLLLLAKTIRRITMAVTGFTLAHSITLSLSALGLVHVPVPPIEAGIALSILFLAREIAVPVPDGLARRFPLAISSLFGLLHGFGFAAALSEAGLPRNEITTSLLFFNAGVEVGQLAFIGAVGALVAVAVRFARHIRLLPIRTAFDRVEILGAYALGIPAAFWFIERLRLF